MEVSQLSRDLKYVEANGVTLSIDERMRLDLATQVLVSELPDYASSIQLWGKIRGTIRDYYIVYYHGRSKTEAASQIPPKHFFWCNSSNYTFSMLPTPNQEAMDKLGSLSYLFSGEFDQVLVESSEAPKVIDAVAGIVLPPKHLTELDRLSVVVHMISDACSALPRGSAKCIPTGQVLFNEAFCGLGPDEASELSAWQHLRPIKQADKKSLQDRQVHVYNDDFLDTLVADKPQKCWSVQRDCTGGLVVLRSQLWPGYYAYHRCNTPIFGSLYIGDGLCNTSLPFML